MEGKLELGWWFSDGYRLQYGDQRIPVVGATHTHAGPVAVCESGLHWSRDALTALGNAPGTTAWLVWGEELDEQDGKSVGRQRIYAGRVDATAMLVQFAEWCAERAAAYASRAAADASWAAAAASRAAAAAYASWAAAYASRAAAERREQNLYLTRLLLAEMERQTLATMPE